MRVSGLKGVGRVVGWAGVGTGVLFGTIALVAGLVSLATGKAALGAVLLAALLVAGFFGTFAAGATALLAAPFIGIAGTIAGTQAARRKLEQWKFNRERPGKRLPGETVGSTKQLGPPASEQADPEET